MTWVGIAASPAFRAGFLICAEKGFMVLSYLMRQQRAGGRRAVGWVRPAWARSYGCESRRKLVTVNEVKRNCMRVTECGEEAWIEAAGR